MLNTCLLYIIRVYFGCLCVAISRELQTLFRSSDTDIQAEMLLPNATEKNDRFDLDYAYGRAAVQCSWVESFVEFKDNRIRQEKLNEERRRKARFHSNFVDEFYTPVYFKYEKINIIFVFCVRNANRTKRGVKLLRSNM